MFPRCIRDSQKPRAGEGRDPWVSPGPGQYSGATTKVLDPRITGRRFDSAVRDACQRKARGGITANVPMQRDGFSSFHVKYVDASLQ